MHNMTQTTCFSVQLVEGLLTGIEPGDTHAYRQMLDIIRVSSLNCYQFDVSPTKRGLLRNTFRRSCSLLSC